MSVNLKCIFFVCDLIECNVHIDLIFCASTAKNLL